MGAGAAGMRLRIVSTLLCAATSRLFDPVSPVTFLTEVSMRFKQWLILSAVLLGLVLAECAEARCRRERRHRGHDRCHAARHCR